MKFSSVFSRVPAGLVLALLFVGAAGGRSYISGEAQQLTATLAKRDAAAQRRHAAPRQPQVANARQGWSSPDLHQTPGLDLQAAVPQTAEQANALRPFAGLPIEPMRPFVLKTDAADRARAEHCLAQAIYYEAAREPLAGQEAIAQVVLNRVRHPAYPKSVCGVVYQGAARATGCQFTFTCNGALRTAPQPALWARSVSVARRALAGYVDKAVGSATHYHAAYVDPYWAPTLVKMTQVGAHIFYRWGGAWGEPAAFVGHYAGREAVLTPALLASGDPHAAAPDAEPVTRKVTLVSGGETRTYQVADATASGGQRSRVAGVLQPITRQPTADEVRRINEHLASFAKTVEAAPAAEDAATPAKAIAPIVGTQ